MKKILIICLSFFFSLSAFLLNHGYHKLKAEETINPTFIGKIAITESVSEEEKVYINLSDKTFIESTGRIVYAETLGGGGIIFPDPGFPEPGIKPFDFSLNPIIRYYYYAHPNGFDKVVEIIDLYNNIDSVITVLDLLEQRADEFGLTGSDKINAILGYIRSINLRYTGDKWSNLAGGYNTSFIQYINSINDIGIKPNEFFSSFISTNEYNTELHGSKRIEYSDITNLNLIDPLENKEIDLTHLFASIDGSYGLTGYNFLGFDEIVFYGKANRDLTTWLGDIFQGVFSTLDDGRSLFEYDDFEDFMNYSTGCPEIDIISDLDAINIAIQFLDNNYSLKGALVSYYKQSISTWKRYVSFENNIIDGYIDTDFDMFYVFESKIYFSFGLNLDENLIIWENNDIWYQIKEGYFRYGDLGGALWEVVSEIFVDNFNANEREYVAALFIDYIKNCY